MSYLYLLLVFCTVIINTSAEKVEDENPYPVFPAELFDYREILKSQRYFKFLYKCFMNENRCTPQLTAFKRCIPEIIATKCGKCRPSLKRLVDTSIDFIKINYPEGYENITDKYDPEAIYIKRNNYYDELYQGMVDVTLLLEDEQCLARHYSCLMSEGPCTDEGKVLKQIMVEILGENCHRCSRRQSEAVKKASLYLARTNMTKYMAVLNVVFTAQTDDISKSSPEDKRNFYHIDKV
ncbi:uncharacterized protein LOC130666801 [Microplitis mediator]|uniref:uncharacterized protein LOC130666801 n=1 Tax=Microplitis mediator TaxID=375433 RepID=UPI002555B8DA|nr:uncharacterized protein LOC130666801 [Microplitis mediator]